MKTCLPFKIWEAATFVMAKDDVRFYLNGVHLNKNAIESTNGHVAYQAKLSYSDCEYQSLEGQCGFVHLHEFNTEFPDVIIGNFGSKPTKSVLNKTIWVTIETFGESELELVICYIDGSGQKIGMQPAKIIEGRYPDLDKRAFNEVDNLPRDPSVVGFNAEYMAFPKELLKREGEKFNGKCTFAVNQDDNERCLACIDLVRVASPCESEKFLMMSIR